MDRASSEITKKIAVDCRMLHKSGIGVYLANILYYLLPEKNIEWLLIGDEAEIKSLPLTNKCKVQHCTIPIFSLKEQLAFPVEEINRCDIFYTPNYNVPSGIKIPIFLTIHDVVFLDVKGLTTRFGLMLRHAMLARAIKLAHTVFTVSEFSKERIKKYFTTKKEVIVAYNGIRANLLSFDKTTIKPRYDFNYVLFIGNIKKYKGIDILLSAMDGIDKKLIIVGCSENLRTSDKIILDKIRYNDKVIMEEKISDSELYSLIAYADMLVQPSRYEGFGIPPLEALFLGTPAIVSDIPVFKEVYGNMPVTFFDNGNADSLRTAIQNDHSPLIDHDFVKNAYSYEQTAETVLRKLLYE